MLGMLREDSQEVSLNPQPGMAGLSGLIRQLREAGLPVELRVEGTQLDLPPGVDFSAFRIVQEALTNTLKHAQPARAQVIVRYGGGMLDLEIVDDGTPRTHGSDGHGTGWSACGSVPPCMAATSPPGRDPAAGTPCTHGCRWDASGHDSGPHRR